MNKNLIYVLFISVLIHSTIIFTNWSTTNKHTDTINKKTIKAHLSESAENPIIPAPQSAPKKQEINYPLKTLTHAPILENENGVTKHPPQLRIGPNLTISIDSNEEQSCNLLLEINERGRVKNVTVIGKTTIPEEIQEKVITAFKNEAIFIPSTIDGIPSPGHTIIEITLSKSP